MPGSRTPRKVPSRGAESYAEQGHRRQSVIAIGAVTQNVSAAVAAHGWTVVHSHTATNAEQSLAKHRCAPVLVDFRDMDADAVTVIQRLAMAHSDRYWVALVDHANIKHSAIRELIRTTFWDYYTNPPDVDRLIIGLGHAIGMATLTPMEIDGSSVGPLPDDGIIGGSAPLNELRRIVAKVANVDAPILIVGESGSGKEVAARAIHAASKRRNGPFVALNCAALPPTLIQAELFGYERGAFTGAHHRKLGHFESANNGTILLDEIGDLPEALQTTLLRVLQENTIRRVGATKDVSVDLRIMAATHIDLEEAMQQGRFREDLFFRLDVLRLRVPALRERGEDIRLLADHFLEQFTTQLGAGRKRFGHAAWQVIAGHPWPGNIRELRNRVYRAAVMSDSSIITPADMGLEPMSAGEPALPSLEEIRSDAERRAILAALSSCRGDTKAAAAVLKISRATLYRLMEKHDVRPGNLMAGANSAGLDADDAA